MLTESKTMREEYANKDYVLDKVKALVLLPNDTHVTVQMVADYYEVDIDAIEWHIRNNKDELMSDGLKVLKGKELSEFKTESGIQSRAGSLTIIPRRAILRIGMLLRDSEVAKRVRTYLLNVEENTDINTKLVSLSEESNGLIKVLKENINILQDSNNKIITENEELKHITYTLINKVDELLEQPLFKLHTNASREYDKLMLEFLETMELKGVNNTYSNNYTLFNKEFENWTGATFKNNKINKKQYWLNYYGIENIKQFIYGIKQGIIVKSQDGYWVSLSGIYSNKIEWIKTLNEFDNECAYCGSKDIIMADHIRPQSADNSTDILYNLIPCCQKCNDEKDTTDMKEWLKIKKVSQNRIIKIRNHWEKYYIKINK